MQELQNFAKPLNFKQTEGKQSKHIIAEYDEYLNILKEYKFNDALSLIFDKITRVDKYINEEKPWELLQTPNSKKPIEPILDHAVDQILEIAELLNPFMPETSRKNYKTI